MMGVVPQAIAGYWQGPQRGSGVQGELPKGAPHGSCGCVAPLGNDPPFPAGRVLPQNPWGTLKYYKLMGHDTSHRLEMLTRPGTIRRFAGGTMTERVDRHGLRVAKELDDFIAAEALPGTGIGRRDLLVRLQRYRARPDADEPCSARQTRRAAVADRRLAPPTPRATARPRGLQGVPHRDRLSRAGGWSPSRSPRPMWTTRSPTRPARSLSCR